MTEEEFQKQLDIALDKLIAARADRDNALQEYNRAAVRAAMVDMSINKLIADSRTKDLE